MPIYPRHPSVGDLVYTAFSGTRSGTGSLCKGV